VSLAPLAGTRKGTFQEFKTRNLIGCNIWPKLNTMPDLPDLPNVEPFLPDQPGPDLRAEPDWKLYEKAIARIEKSYGNCKVTPNHRPIGRLSGVKRQVDVWLEASVGDNHIVRVAIECRHHTDTPVDIKDIDAFCGFLDDVGANKGVMMSHSGYTDGARKRAEGAGIDLKVLTLEEAEEFDWEEFVQDDCQVENCFGTIQWHFQDGNSEAGRCHNCGTFHIRCGNCGEVSWYHESDIEECLCGMSWRLRQEDGMTSGIEELRLPEKEDEEEEDQE
jgi:hypothetical protein